MSAQRFVVLRHEPGPAGPRERHWDLMLEAGDALRTWALDGEPQIGKVIAASQLPDHRKQYLDYEGPVSKERGTVCQFDCGTYEKISASPNTIEIRLHGSRLHGEVVLKREATSQRWSVEFSSR